MSFSQELKSQNAKLWQVIQDMPFNAELANGSLPQEKFQFYIGQDSLYLEAYSKALSLASAKAPSTDAMLEFAQGAQVAIEVERALHEGFFKQFGVTPPAEASPTCTAYTNFLLSTAASQGYAELIAAILPCFWVYWDVGCHIAKSASPDNPYQAWIDTYADDGFGQATDRVIALVDAAAVEAGPETKARMAHAFHRCTQYEWMFWDSAYRLEAWPV